MTKWAPLGVEAMRSLEESTARINIWHGPVRSGKTITSIARWLAYIGEAPPGHLLMVGKTERTLKRNVLDEIERLVGRRNYRFVGGSGEVFLYGRKILLAGANDQRAEGKIRGLTGAGAYGDEMSLWPESFTRMLLSRLSVPEAKLFGTTNPDGPYSYLKTDFIDREHELDLRAFTWPIEANPGLTTEYIESLKAEYGEGSLWYKRFIEGLWVAAEGAVYDFWDEKKHTIPASALKAPDQIDLSIDYGTSNATSAGAYGSWNRVPPGELKAVRLAGYYYDGRATGRQKTDREYAEEIKTWTDEFASMFGKPVRHVFLDPSAASFKVELRKHGFSVRPAKNDVIDGIRTQAKMLRAGEYKIAKEPSNDPCIRDYGAYLWDAKAQARGEDKPLKQNDHTKDEERYYLHTMFGQSVTDRATAESIYR